jgi:hypothetical protein
MKEVISFTTGLYIFAYLASILASMLMFDAALLLVSWRRCLSPYYVARCLNLDANKRRSCDRACAPWRFDVQTIVTSTPGPGGRGSTFQWYDAKAMAFLRELPDDVMIYTNEPGAVYLYTGRGSYVLPDRFDSATAEVRTNFDEGVTSMQTKINSGKAVLALFDNGDNVSGDVPALTAGLYLAHKSAGDSIYTAKP